LWNITCNDFKPIFDIINGFIFQDAAEDNIKLSFKDTYDTCDGGKGTLN
jgi:hypothetical protein